MLWQIDQVCFPPGIAYTQMELSGFITRRNAITLVAEFEHGILPLDSRQQSTAMPIAGFVIAHPVRRKYGRILTLDILPDARRFGLATKLMNAVRRDGCARWAAREVFLETAVE